jgi:hypothetical protein
VYVYCFALSSSLYQPNTTQSQSHYCTRTSTYIYRLSAYSDVSFIIILLYDISNCTYRMYHLKCNPSVITYYDTKIKPEAGPPHVADSQNLPRETRIKVTLFTRPLLRDSCAKAVQVRTWFIHLQNEFTSSKIISH